jgi:hypothetical protein
VRTNIWFPAYHHTIPINATENIRGDVKQWVRIHIKLDNMRQLCEQWFAEISEMEWGTICQHVQNVEQQHTETEKLMEPVVEKLVSSVHGSSSSANSSSSCKESDSTTDVDCSRSNTDDVLQSLEKLD